MEYFKCFSARLAHELRKKGFWIVGIEPNLKKPWLDVFLFEDTEELRAAVNEYCNK